MASRLQPATQERVPPLRGSDSFPTLPSTPPSAPCWAKLFRPCGTLVFGFVLSDSFPCGNPARDKCLRCPTPLGCAGGRLLSAAFADKVGRLPHSMRPSPPSQRTNIAAVPPFVSS